MYEMSRSLGGTLKLPKYLVFDLDNTIFNADLAYEKALVKMGLSLGDPEYRKARDLVKHRLPADHVCARNRLLYFKALLENKGKYSPKVTLDMMMTYEKTLFEETQRQVTELEREKLWIALKARGHRLAILTNENLRTQLIKLNAIDPEGKYFDFMVTSEELGVEKPDLKMFNECMQRWGAQPSECMMIGDDFERDILSAESLGWQVIVSREFCAGITMDRVYICRQLTEILAI